MCKFASFSVPVSLFTSVSSNVLPNVGMPSREPRTFWNSSVLCTVVLLVLAIAGISNVLDCIDSTL